MSAWFLGGVICIHFLDFTILHHLEERLYISYGFLQQALLFLLSLINYFYSSQGLPNQEKESVQGTYEEMVWKRREMFRINKKPRTCPAWTPHLSKCYKPGFILALSILFLVLAPTPFEMAE